MRVWLGTNALVRGARAGERNCTQNGVYTTSVFALDFRRFGPMFLSNEDATVQKQLFKAEAKSTGAQHSKYMRDRNSRESRRRICNFLRKSAHIYVRSRCCDFNSFHSSRRPRIRVAHSPITPQPKKRMDKAKDDQTQKLLQQKLNSLSPYSPSGALSPTSGEPIDKHNFVHIVSLSLGVGTLLAYNVIVTASDYFTQEYPSYPNIMFYIVPVYTLPDLVFMFLMIRYGHDFSFTSRILISFLLSALLLALIPFFAQAISEDVSFYLIMLVAFIIGLRPLFPLFPFFPFFSFLHFAIFNVFSASSNNAHPARTHI